MNKARTLVLIGIISTNFLSNALAMQPSIHSIHFRQEISEETSDDEIPDEISEEKIPKGLVFLPIPTQEEIEQNGVSLMPKAILCNMKRDYLNGCSLQNIINTYGLTKHQAGYLIILQKI